MPTHAAASAAVDAETLRSGIGAGIDDVDALLETHVDSFPAVDESPLQYAESDGRGVSEWTAGFWPGLLWIAHDYTDDDRYRRVAEGLLDRFAERLREGDAAENHHDLGFLFAPSALAAHDTIESRRGRDLAVEAADRLVARFHAAPGVIQAWGDYRTPGDETRTIIDTLLNLPLLFRAAEIAGIDRYRRAATTHARQAAEHQIRERGATVQHAWFDVESGALGHTESNHPTVEDSCWSRGQAWAIYGFAIAHRHTGLDRFLSAARTTADYYLDRLSESHVPPSHFALPDDDPLVDTSAAAIAASGLLEIAEQLPRTTPNRTRYETAALRTLRSLATEFVDDSADGLLVGAYGGNFDQEICGPWGDYFYLEALVRAVTDWRPVWSR